MILKFFTFHDVSFEFEFFGFPKVNVFFVHFIVQCV